MVIIFGLLFLIKNELFQPQTEHTEYSKRRTLKNFIDLNSDLEYQVKKDKKTVINQLLDWLVSEQTGGIFMSTIQLYNYEFDDDTMFDFIAAFNNISYLHKEYTQIRTLGQNFYNNVEEYRDNVSQTSDVWNKGSGGNGNEKIYNFSRRYKTSSMKWYFRYVFNYFDAFTHQKEPFLKPFFDNQIDNIPLCKRMYLLLLLFFVSFPKFYILYGDWNNANQSEIYSNTNSIRGFFKRCSCACRSDSDDTINIILSHMMPFSN